MGGADSRAVLANKEGMLPEMIYRDRVLEKMELHKVPRAWRKTLAITLLVFSAMASLYWETYASIVQTWWRTGAYNHGFFILPMVGFLLWRRRHGLASIRPYPAPLVTALLLLLSGLWIVGRLSDVLLLQHFSVVAMISAVIWSLWGTNAALYVAFPLAYLLFATPFGDFLIPSLQEFTANFTVRGLQSVGIPVFLEGNLIKIPSGSFLVEEACSGLRYLIASLTLGTYYAYLMFASNLRRLAFILFCIAVPLLANGLRAFGVVLLAHWSNYKLAVGVDHIIYGWVFFGVVMFLIFLVGSYFSDEGKPIGHDLPAHAQLTEVPGRYRAIAGSVVAVFLSIGAGPVFAYYLDSTRTTMRQEVTLPQLNNVVWLGPERRGECWRSEFLGADYLLDGMYINGKHEVELCVAVYYKQQQGREVISLENHRFDDRVWHLIGERIWSIKSPFGYVRVQEQQVSSGAIQQVLWTWYQVDGHSLIRPLKVKLHELLARLAGREPVSTVIILGSAYQIDAEEARQRLRSFLDEAWPYLRTLGIAIEKDGDIHSK